MKKILWRKLLLFIIFFGILFNTLSNTFANESCEFRQISKKYPYVNNVEYSNDWKSLVFLVANKLESFLILNWERLEWYDYISDFSFIWKWKDYIFIWKLDWEYFLVKNWKILSKGYEKISNLKVSDNWNNIFFVWKKLWKFVFVKNWKEIWWYFESIMNIKYFSEWNDFAFLWKKYLKYHLIKNWEDFYNHSRLNELAISNDWTKVSYSIWYEYAYVSENKIEKPWEFYSIKYFQYSNDSKKLWFIAKDITSLKEYLVENGSKVWEEYEKIEDFKYIWNWSSYIFKWLKDWKYSIIKDWVKSLWEYESIRYFEYNRDLDSYVFNWYINWEYYIVKDGKEISEWYSNIKNYYFYNKILLSLVKKDWKYMFLKDWKQYWEEYNDYVDLVHPYKKNDWYFYNKDNKTYFLKNLEENSSILKDSYIFSIDNSWEKTFLEIYNDNIKELNDLSNIFINSSRSWDFVIPNWETMQKEYQNIWDLDHSISLSYIAGEWWNKFVVEQICLTQEQKLNQLRDELLGTLK